MKQHFTILQTAFLGDLILTIPLLKCLRLFFRESHIHLVVRHGFKDVLEDQNLFDSISEHKKGSGTSALINSLKHPIQNTDTQMDNQTIILAQRSFRSGLAARLSGAQKIIGHRGSGAWPFLTRQVPFRDVHESERLLDLIRSAIGEKLPIAQDMFHMSVSQQSKESAASLLGELQEGRYLAVAPGSAWNTKRWPASRYGRLISAFWKEFKLPSVIVGSSDESRIAQKVMAYSSPRPLDLTGFTDFTALKGIIQGAKAFVSGDTGTAHIAAAFRIPQITIFGPTKPEQGFTPLSPEAVVVDYPCPCRPCGKHGSKRCPIPYSKDKDYGNMACMKSISVEKIMNTLKKKMPVP